MTCYDCIHCDACSDAGDSGFSCLKEDVSKCKHFKNKADFVEVVRCGKCVHARKLEKHCEINRDAYRHCSLDRGEETINVWHKYTKYYKNYSIVALNDYCNEGERSDT